MQQELWSNGHKLVAVLRNPETTGRPFIFLHGITASIEWWPSELMAPFLAQGPCYSLSLPGHYPAAFPPGYTAKEITVEMIVTVLSAAIRQLANDQPVTLVGHSTGGFAVLALAARQPDLADRLICISGFARGQWRGTFGTMQAISRRGRWGKLIFRVLFASNRVNRTLQAYSWSANVHNFRRLADSADFWQIHRALFPNYRRLDLQAMADYFEAIADVDITDWLPRITAPTLIMSGAQDLTIPPDETHSMAQRIPQSTATIIEECGHLPHLEQTGRFNEIVAAWLQETQPFHSR
jgi:pimeloyl-ACP methyl ester carboxylesterase